MSAKRESQRKHPNLRSVEPANPGPSVSVWNLGTTPTTEIQVGSRLRALREEHDWSLRELAEKSGLALNTVSLIENAKTSPSVSTLQQLARALTVPITAFFETEPPKKSIVHIKATQRPRIAFAHGMLEDLGAGLTHQAVEPFIVTLEPNMGSGPDVMAHTGYEFVYCLKGCITYAIQEQTYILESGDSLLFESHLPHRWHNANPDPAQALLVLYPSDARDHPSDQHFAQGEAQK